MLKTIKLTNGIFHGFFFVVDLDIFQDIDSLIAYSREKLCALCTLHNLEELLVKARLVEISTNPHSSLQEMMLSHESIICLTCKEPKQGKAPLKEVFLSESVNY